MELYNGVQLLTLRQIHVSDFQKFDYIFAMVSIIHRSLSFQGFELW